MFTKLLLALPMLALAAAAPVEKRITHTGQATYFEVGLGACGSYNVDTDMIVALNSAQYEANDGGNCGQYLEIENTSNGKTAYAYVADECPSCAYGSLDMSPALFSELSGGDMDEGVFPISWHFKSKSWTP
ncbi:hypothetical protein Q5752_004434 [Cryptotrichosporon argae]